MISKDIRDAFNGRAVFITGHTGFKGAWLCAMLLQLGAKLYGYSLDEPADPRHIYHALRIRSQLANGPTSIGDVRDFENLQNELENSKPDFLFHLAAQPIVSVSYKDPYKTFTSNVLGVTNVLELLRTGFPSTTSVLVTSDKCYKNKEQTTPYSEDDEMGGDDPYSASKGAAELVFHSYQKSYPMLGKVHGIATARAGNVFGGGDWSPDRLIPDCARQSLAGREIEIRMPNAVRPWTFVVDILWGYLSLGTALRQSPEKHRGSWNFASGETKTVAEVVEKFIASIGKGSVRVNTTSSVGKEASLLLIDPAKARDQLLWKPRFDVDSAIAHTAQWYKLQSEGRDMAHFTNAFLKTWYTEA